ncbi:MAG TPA: hypothetical protein VFO36_05330, partial [Nitrospiraceae bacterium]|nr:hypothetical protein [Nitrospiraceae bacterium]
MDLDEHIADLFARWKSGVQGGTTLTPEELCKDCPELLDAFRERLPLLQAVDALFESESNESGT